MFHREVPFCLSPKENYRVFPVLIFYLSNKRLLLSKEFALLNFVSKTLYIPEEKPAPSAKDL